MRRGLRNRLNAVRNLAQRQDVDSGSDSYDVIGGARAAASPTSRSSRCAPAGSTSAARCTSRAPDDGGEDLPSFIAD